MPEIRQFLTEHIMGPAQVGFVVTCSGDGPEVRADYTLLANRARIERSQNGATESLDIPLRKNSPAPLMFPLRSIFSGPLIAGPKWWL